MHGTTATSKQIQPKKYFLVAIALALLVLLSVTAGDAQAARVHQLEVSETLPNGETPLAVAVNSTTHHFYVASSVGSGHPRVYNFDAEGQLDPAHPELTGALLSDPTSVAVDNSGGDHAEDIYVVNAGQFFSEGTVQQFDSAGNATAVTITESAIPANNTAQAGGLPPVINNGRFEPEEVAVDSSGDVFVSDTSARVIDVFTATGVFVRQLGSALSVAVGSGDGIAIGGPDIYLALSVDNNGMLNAGLYKLDATTGECIPVGCAPIDPAPIFGVAVDRAAGTIFTAGLVNPNDGAGGGKVTEYDAATGSLLGVTRPQALHSPAGISVDETSHKVIAADTDGTVKIFGPEETVPDLKTLPSEAVTDHSVTLKGEIGAAGLTGVTCVFQYVDQEGFEGHGFEGAAEVPCVPGGPFSGEAPNPVHADLTGLRGGTTYHERIRGANSEVSNLGEDIPFVTNGPSVAATEAVGITDEAAILKGTVDPNGSATTYRFQYLTQASFEADGWTGAIEVPAGGVSLGGGSAALPVSQAISGLIPGTAYTFRILAVSADGTTEGKKVEFTVQQSPLPGLPDGRAYEQVSPVQKNGANIQGAINAVQASLDGERITFFSDAGIPGGEGTQDFPTYMASRAPDGSGWSTQGLLPPAAYGPVANVLGWSEDLDDTYDFAIAPSKEGELLRMQSSGGPLTQVAGGPSEGFAYAGSSQDGAVALLQSRFGGVKDAAGSIGDLEGKQNVYAYDRESGRLVVAGVMNDGTVPSDGAMAGSYDWFKSGDTTYPGGAFNRYYTQPGHAISADGSEVFFTAGGTGQIYVRLNPFAPQSVTSSEGCTEAAKACTVRVSAPASGVTDPGTPAAFLGASTDGHLVYFLDKGKLTTNATGGSGYDLYRYDVSTGSLTDLTLDTADRGGARVEGMLGIGGPAGEDAYFVAAGKLVEGTPQEPVTQAPAGETNLYALHGTAVGFVTRLGTDRAENGDWLDWTPTADRDGGATVAHASRISSDGQTLLFSSTRRLTAYDSHGMAELYLFRTGAPISCVSCNPSGEAPSGPAGVQQIPTLVFAPAHTYSIMTRNLSADGRRVFFDSPDRLVSADHNDVNDVYEWEAEGEGSCTSDTQDGGCLFLISGGAAGAAPSWFGDADEKGENVFFFTAQRLVAQDKDELVDVYDARVAGGIATQETTPQAPCEDLEGCRGAAPAPPAPFSAPATSALQGPGNPPTPAAKPAPNPAPKSLARCRKGRVRVHGKCVVKRGKQKRHGKPKGRKKRVQKRGKGARR